MQSIDSVQTQKTLNDLAKSIGGEVVGDANIVIRGACGLREATVGDITLVLDSKNLSAFKKSKATAAIISRDISCDDKPVIKTDDPCKAFLKILEIWRPLELTYTKGIHANAVISKSAKLGNNVTVGPGVVIEDACVIGDDTVVLANSFIGRRSTVGQNSLIYQNATIRENTRIDDRVIIHCGVCIGSDGYGFHNIEGKHIKIPQVGNVWIQSDVEIGANSCVDRARFGTTVIKRGTKIDNLVQIAHNVVVGEDCLIISQAGIAGSSELGDRVILAGQAALVDNIKLGDDCVVGAKSGVVSSAPDKSILLGIPA